ncbi:MAG: PaaI family thioesterase [Lachnospiraceae bacterium]
MDFQEVINYRNKENQFMGLVGIKLTQMEEGYAVGEIELKAHHKNLIGSVHGGCIFSLADSIAGAAAMSRGDRATTLSSDFHYLSPALTCEKLIASAKEIKNGKTITVIEVDVKDEKEILLAKGTFSYFSLGKI